MLKETTTENQKLNFSQLLENYEYVRPKKGEFYDAEVMLVDDDRILVDLGAKTDGVVTPRELRDTDEDLIEQLNVGDQVPVYVKAPPSMLRKTSVSIQKGAEKSEWDRAKALHESGKAIEMEVVGKNKGGLLVKMGRLRGFVPASLVPVVARFSSRKLREKVKSQLVGQRILLHAIQVEPRRNKLIFSMREHPEKIKELRLAQLNVGDVLDGIVVNIADYGAFISVIGVDGLLHISEISWEHVEDISEILSQGDRVEVEIVEIDRKEGKLKLSRKRLLPTPGLAQIEELVPA